MRTARGSSGRSGARVNRARKERCSSRGVEAEDRRRYSTRDRPELFTCLHQITCQLLDLPVAHVEDVAERQLHFLAVRALRVDVALNDEGVANLEGPLRCNRRVRLEALADDL